MITIAIVSDGFSHFNEAINEYIKRLGKDIRLVKIKPEKKGEISTIINKETERIKEFIKTEKGYIVGLDFEGDEFYTEDFNDFVSKILTRQSKIVFIIGGSYGYNKEELNSFIHKKLSLSKMTFPHSLSFLILLEQIYRIKMIEKNTGYHH